MRVGIIIATIISFFSNDLVAAYFREGGFLAQQGILESIRIEPPLPANGETFTVISMDRFRDPWQLPVLEDQ